jgi:Domain of unknown function (DUF4279)
MMNFTDDLVRCQITIETDTLTPAQISERVGTEFDVAHRVGEPRGRTGKTWETNVWQLRETRSGTEDSGAHDLLPLCLDGLLKRALAISAGLTQVVADFGGEFAIHTTSASIPGISLSDEQVRQIADLGLSMDIDIVLIADECNA